MGLSYRIASRLRTVDGRPIAVGSHLRVVKERAPLPGFFSSPLMRLSTYTGAGFPQYILVFSVDVPPTPEEVEMFGPLMVGGPDCDCDVVCENLHNFAVHFPDLSPSPLFGSRLVYLCDSEYDAHGSYEVVAIVDNAEVANDNFNFRAGNQYKAMSAM